MDGEMLCYIPENKYYGEMVDCADTNSQEIDACWKLERIGEPIFFTNTGLIAREAEILIYIKASSVYS